MYKPVRNVTIKLLHSSSPPINITKGNESGYLLKLFNEHKFSLKLQKYIKSKEKSLSFNHSNTKPKTKINYFPMINKMISIYDCDNKPKKEIKIKQSVSVQAEEEKDLFEKRIKHKKFHISNNHRNNSTFINDINQSKQYLFRNSINILSNSFVSRRFSKEQKIYHLFDNDFLKEKMKNC